MWNAMWNNFYTYLKNMSTTLKGFIIFVLITCALISMAYALKGKDKAVHDWFLFFLSILFAVLAVVFAVVTGLMKV